MLMPPLLVCGNVNLESVFCLEGELLPPQGGFFPHSMTLNVSGVGANLALALKNLGSPVRLLTFGADDLCGKVVRAALEGIEVCFSPSSATPQSLALVRPDGSRTFYRDLKDTMGTAAPTTDFLNLITGCAAVLMTNINWTRPLLPLALEVGLPILTDVQDLRDLHNPYDQDYFRAADLLFLSAEHLEDPATVMESVLERFPARLVVAGWGQRGALLLERGGELYHQPAFPVGVLSTGGAGDTLAASFAHFYFSRGKSAPQSLRLACAAAALKVRAIGSGQGHPDEEAVLRFVNSQ